MMRPGDIWGVCPKRYVGWSQQDGNVVGAWCYICSKDGKPCNPEYCLGPDEDVDDEAKGETHEQEVR